MDLLEKVKDQLGYRLSLDHLGAERRPLEGLHHAALGLGQPVAHTRVHTPRVKHRFQRTHLLGPLCCRAARHRGFLIPAQETRCGAEEGGIPQMDEQFLKRSVNAGFSGGEKKRNEILQMAVLEPKLAILDETDSGLDIDALRVVADGVNALRSPDRAMIVVTHYQRLLDYIQPDYVHVLAGGRIVRSGDRSLALELEEKGYGWILEEAAA